MRLGLALILSLLLLGLGSAGCSDPPFKGADGSDSPFDGGWPPPPGSDGNINPQRPSCPGQEGSITGKVLAPNGADPVPGASVFIPAAVPELFPPGVRCEVCGSLGGANNLWYATSAYDGTFTLSGVCPGKRSVVLQNGRFRRLITVDVPAKGQVTLTASESRLPRRTGEFNVTDAVPKIAVATGDFDKMECVLKKIGLEDSAIELYEDAVYLKSKKTLPLFSSLVNDLAKMRTYNIIFINCTDNTFEDELLKPGVRDNITKYITEGGRFYVTDWSFDWIEQVEAFSPFIDFEPGPWGTTPEKANAGALGADGLKIKATIKDPAMAKWLGLFPGAVTNDQSDIQYFLNDWVMMHAVAKDVKVWIEGPVKSNPKHLPTKIDGIRPLTVTFNFKNCGKILYTSYHTEGRDDEVMLGLAKPYPQYCTAGTSPQDRILEYLIFDIANCVKPVE